MKPTVIIHAIAIMALCVFSLLDGKRIRDLERKVETLTMRQTATQWVLSTIPSACSVGETATISFLDTPPRVYSYTCTATDTWTLRK